MDPEANMREQLELAAEVMVIWDRCPEDGQFGWADMDRLCNIAYRMAELVQAMSEYRAGEVKTKAEDNIAFRTSDGYVLRRVVEDVYSTYIDDVLTHFDNYPIFTDGDMTFETNCGWPMDADGKLEEGKIGRVINGVFVEGGVTEDDLNVQ